MVYTKIFLKFPHKFWPCGPGKEFFIYAHERRGYYTFWQWTDQPLDRDFHTLLVDADLRSPSIAPLLGLEKLNDLPGLADSLADPSIPLSQIARRPPEFRFAIFGEDLRHRHVGRCFDLVIGVGEGDLQARGQPFADGGLSRPHHAHQRHGLLQRHILPIQPCYIFCP